MHDDCSTKVCGICSQRKPLLEYDIKKNGRPLGKCKDCRRAYMRAVQARRRAINPQEGRDSALRHYHKNRDVCQERCRAYFAKNFKSQPPTQLTCKTCKETKSVALFKREGAKGTRYTLICNACFNPTANIRRRKARLKNAAGTYTQADVRLKREMQGGKCFYCKKELVDEHIDHKIPVSRGGTNWPANICLACQHCNNRKYNKTPSEFLEFLKRHPIALSVSRKSVS